jgi:hypothetical protein
MHRTARAALAAAGVLLLCGHALSQDKVRLPRKGSSPGFEMRWDGKRFTPLWGNDAGSPRADWERWESRENARRAWERARQRRWELERWERERRASERRERQERAERRQREQRQAYCTGLANASRAAHEEAKRRVIVGYLAGGLIGALIASSQNDDAYRDGSIVWQEAYDDCMGIRSRNGGRQDDDDDDGPSAGRNGNASGAGNGNDNRNRAANGD